MESDDSAEPDKDDLACIRELLAAGVGLERVTRCFQGRLPEEQVLRAARETLKEHPDAGNALLILERSKSAVHNEDFVTSLMESLSAEAPEELVDPLFGALMQDPGVLSSGFIVDRATALENGRLKFSMCPWSRTQLKPDIYPLVSLKGRLQHFKAARLTAMLATARALLVEKSWVHLDELLRKADEFLADLGERTYAREAREIAEVALTAAAAPGRDVEPARHAECYVRIHRSLETGEGPAFAERVQLLVISVRAAIAEGRLREAEEWLRAVEQVKKECQVALPAAKLRLELAKAAKADLQQPRLAVYRELLADPEAAQAFLRAEGMSEEEVRNRSPLLMVKMRIEDREATDEQKLALASPVLEGPVAKILVEVEHFSDQGWGNHKGNLLLELQSAGGESLALCNLFGTYRSEGYNTHDGSHNAPRRTLTEEAVVLQATAGCHYRMLYTVGGGGGHLIKVENWRVKVYPVGFNTEEPVTIAADSHPTSSRSSPRSNRSPPSPVELDSEGSY